VNKPPVPARFFEKQGEHIFPMLSRLVLTDTKSFASITEKSGWCVVCALGAVLMVRR
jgi:hypothetical protein